ncbi:hypothetical protein ZIOFF_049342 [Zingiber officinale]|uniref:Leucine-rich repeat-containing N-terminal plant-type domain-containing protein n=1 Tax=Zingiber officinale TaxID=94328 RepID=A0A8J5FSP3_ZINOF|nr:hypothetical protein ZIOFF_049342 [Zingiber officinale]
MATAWRSALRFREPWPLHHPHYRCYYQLPLVMLCWLIIILASFLVEGTGVEGRVSSKGCLQGERDALLHYKAAIRDPSDRLSSWQEAQGDDCCSWTGVVCYNVTERAAYNDFEGSQIPPLVGSLHELRYLDLSYSNSSGPIPPHLGNLTDLRYLDLSWSDVNGIIPPHLGNLTNLRYLDLRGNFNLYFPKDGDSLDRLSGLSSLIYLDIWQWLHILQLRSNMFNGNIDPQLGYLGDLQIIDFANNKLSGLIPHSFGNFSTMISTLVEPLPSFGFDEMAILETMPVSSGSESITLDTKGSQLTYSSILYLVKSIDLSNNELTNEIPEELGYLAGLQTLNLSRNYFKGKILDSIGGMSSLETLDLSFNNLSGVIPQGVSQLNALNHLNLSYNNLSGNIPYGNQL